VKYDSDALVEAWLRYQETGDKADLWAVRAVDELTSPRGDPTAAWNLLSRLFAAAADELLGAVAVGPLENLVARFGPQLISQIEETSRRDPRFRSALSRVWITTGQLPGDIEARVVAASNGAIRSLPGGKARWNRPP